MRAAAIVRLVMVGVIIAVLGAIALLWRGNDEREITAEEVTEPVVEPGVVSRSRQLRYTAESNGVRQYELRAGRGVRFDDNRAEYSDEVALLLYGAPVGEEGVQEVTEVTAQRLEVVERPVPVDGDAYESVQLFGDVRAKLPKGQEFTSDAIVYRDRNLSTNRGVRLHAGGLVIESRQMNYDPDANLAELDGLHPASARDAQPGPVKLWTEGAGAEGEVPPLTGNARSLRYEVRESRLNLRGDPAVVLPEAAIGGVEIDLELDEAASALTRVVTRGNASAVWTPEQERAYEALAEVIEIPLLDGRPRALIAFTEDPELPRPAFELGEGSLRADRIEVTLAGDGGNAVAASGDAFFIPQAGSGFRHIGAQELSLGPGSFDELVADGEVEILRPAPQGEEARFAGARARVVFRDGALVDAEWPVGLRYSDPVAGMTVSGGYAILEPETGDWLLRPAAPGAPPSTPAPPRPRFESPDFDVSADTIRMAESGAVTLTGAVDARLRGDAIRTVGPLFGDATEIIAAADELRLAADGRRLDFVGRARIFQPQGDQLLQADEITLMPERNELLAAGSVFVSLVDPADPERGRAEARTIVLTGGQLLIEGGGEGGVDGEPLRLTVADAAQLDLEQTGRTIGGGRLTVSIDDEGAWRGLEVHDNVVLTDPAGTGRGARLEYDADAEVVIIDAAPGGQATFVPDQGIDISDRQGLRLTWLEDGLEVVALQNGTTQIVGGGGR